MIFVMNSMKIIGFSLKSIVLLAFLVGAYYHFRPKRNTCAMTYMYQQPEYIPIALTKVTRRSFPAYKLYSYGEGSYARRLQSKHYEGIPVLFLHGNAGSYKQVRSLASVSMTKADSNRSPLHFNYFAADFSEELSAIYGNFLFKQTEFTSICIDVILKLYEGRPNPPKSVIIVGHSMGGMTARALFTLRNFDSNVIQLIITMATPHSEPVFTPDSYMEDFYSRVNRHWHDNRNFSLLHVNLVSISGGHKDLMVRSDLSDLSLNKEPSHERDISILSNAIPGVWTGMDHLCIVWCKQLVLAIVRTTFRLVDRDTRQLIGDSDTRHRLLMRLLVDGAHIKSHSLMTVANWTVPLMYEDLWTSRRSERWEYRLMDTSSAPSVLLLTVGAGSTRDRRNLFISTLNMNIEPWIFACESKGHLCHVTGIPVCETLLVPSSDGLRKVFHCDKLDSTHFVIKLPSEDIGKVEVYAELFDPAERHFATSWFSSAVGFEPLISKNSMFSSVKLADLSETWEAYRVEVHTSGASCEGTFGGVIHLSVPWNFEDTFESIEIPESEHSISLHSSRPPEYSKADGQTEIRFYLNTKCEYSITVRLSLLDLLAQIVRFYIHTCPAFVAAASLQILSGLQSTDRKESRTTSVSVMTMVQSMVKVFAVTTTMHFIFDNLGLVSAQYERWWSIVPLLIVYVTSSVTVTASIHLIRVAALIIGKILSVFPCQLSSQRVGSCNSLVAVLLTSFVLVVGQFVCGTAATFVTILVLMIRSKPLMSKSQDIHLTCCLIWGLIFLFGLPTLIVRLVHFGFGQFAPDPTLFHSYFITLLLFGGRFFLDDLTNTKRLAVTWLVRCHSMLAIGILVFGVDHLHRIPWFLIFDCLLLFIWPILFLEKIYKSTRGLTSA